MLGRSVIKSASSLRQAVKKSNQIATPAISTLQNFITDNSHVNSTNNNNSNPIKGAWFSTAAETQPDASPASTPVATATPKQAPTPFKATPERKYQFFQNVHITPEGIAIIKFDNPTKKVNTISFTLKDEAETLWNDEIHTNPSVKGVVFTSAKKDNFIAGADIFDIQSLEKKEDVIPLIESATSFFQHLKSKNVPLVCAIDGSALGGGLEWALWCDYLICTDSSKTKLGLPEVKLGLLPGFGGTQNLHKLVGLQKAMDMMLTGKDIRPKQAKRMGLVDLVVAPQSLEQVAIETAIGLANGTIKRSKGKKKSLMDKAVEDTSLGRYFMWRTIQDMVQKNTNGKYPAPFAIIDSVKYGLDHPSGDAKFKFEREAFAKLAATSESEALIGIFDGMTRMKKHEYGELAHPVKKVAVMGAGLMGAGIAQVTAEKGLEVLLKDRDDAAISRGTSYINDNWGKKVKRKRMSNYQYNINTSNIVGLTDNMDNWKKHFGGADMVIEAVFEDLDLKRKIIAQCEEVTPDHCIFATNTSAIPIADIAQGAKRPEQIIGMHYFSPVPSMPLLEVIPHAGTADMAKAAALDVGTKQGKTCIEVKDVPGFYVNRCLGPFLIEVSALVRDGVKLEAMDKAMKNFGMPVGPITLADEVGIDVTYKVASFLSQADLGVRMTGGDVSLMENMINKGWLGKKSGQGFYTYKGKKKTINSDVQAYVNEFAQQDLGLNETDIQDRIVSRFVNEAAKCLEDEIISDPVVGDIGLVFGTGFAPFRGGPFRYLDTEGVDKYVGMMNDLADKYGPQFEPCQLLKDYATSGKKFHN
jgi:enoyl-CoA hydratase/long-chain 3-hydroxyacyl-CoA dehydrogenase